ncbi:MAG: hypothetical protein M1816_003197 [Peltula sp. TS41687]|nr:MAG: hypothetical protein M1816_003197 [Peltula sp. TS41687]
MSGIALKLTALIIRTGAKQIAGVLKAQAKEHPRFRRLCMSFAQTLHRWDMRLKLGLLRDVSSKDTTAATEVQSKKQHKQDKIESSSSSSSSSSKDELTTSTTTTSSSSSSPIVGDKIKAKDSREKEKDKSSGSSKQRIRPLTEAKAIDSGATFISESFIFVVAGSLIVFESWRQRRKENLRKEDVADRLAELEESEKNAKRALVALEKEIIRLRAEHNKSERRILPKEVWEVEEDTDEGDDERKKGFWGWLTRLVRTERKNEVDNIEGPPKTPPPPKPNTSSVQESFRSPTVKA